MKKKVFAALLALSMLLSAVPVIGETAPAEKDVTVMIYMCGADLELKRFQGTSTMAEINATGFNTEKVNVIALLGGTSAWSRGYDTSKLTVVQLGGRRPVVVDELPLGNMGQAETLTGFLDYCHQNYPAKKYDLVMWDHGGGPNYGVIFDWLFDQDSLSIAELRNAFGQSVFADKGLDIIAFNSCLTGGIEYAANLAPYANYMVATEDSMYGLSYGWLKTLDTDSTEDTLKQMVDGTFALNKTQIELQNALEINAVAAVDLSKVQTVVAGMDDFFSNVTPNTNTNGFVRVSQQRRDTKTFGSTESNGASNRDLADLGDLVTHLRDYAPEKADALLAALNEAVVYKQAVTDDCSGLTVYHPYSNKQTLKKNIAAHNDIPLSAAYSAFIQQFAAMLTDTPLADWTNLHTDPVVDKDSRTLFTLKLSDSQAENLAYARMFVLHQQADGVYRQVFDNPSSSLKDNGLTGEFNGIALYAANGDELLSPALTYEINEGNGVYLIRARLTSKAKEENTGDFTADGLICCALDQETRQLVPGTVLILDEASGGYSSIYCLKFADFDEISIPLISRKPTRNDAGILLPFNEWEAAEETAWTAPIDGSWNFAFKNDTIDTAELYAAFQVTDAQYNLYSSEPAVVKAKAPILNDDEIRVEYDDLGLALINSFTVAPVGQNLILSAEVTNLTETEAFITMTDLTLNGSQNAAEATAYGNGGNWGLLKDETQFLQLSLPLADLAGMSPITEITFDLRLVNAADETQEIGVVPVNVYLLLELNN